MDYRPPVEDFPLLAQHPAIIYLDSAATAQKPQVVLDAVMRYYQADNANVHRGVHFLSDQATCLFEDARRTVANFIHATHPEEVIWTRGTTEGINLVAQTFAPTVLAPGAIVVISEMEHHSNIVPWQLVCQRVGAQLKAVRVGADGTLDMDHYRELLKEDVRIVAVTHVSNVTGVVNPLKELTSQAHERGAYVLIDGAQAVAHVDVDVQDLDCDFYAFSGHKMYGPTGIGALYGKQFLLERTPPWHGGGEMITEVTIAKSTYQEPPYKFEAGTPNIAGAIGLEAAIKYILAQRKQGLHEYETNLFNTANDALQQISGLSIVCTDPGRKVVLSFLIDGIHPHDLGTLLTEQSVALRTGHHCAMPLMRALNIPGTVRPSLGLYNSVADVDKLVAAIESACRILNP